MRIWSRHPGPGQNRGSSVTGCERKCPIPHIRRARSDFFAEAMESQRPCSALTVCGTRRATSCAHICDGTSAHFAERPDPTLTPRDIALKSTVITGRSVPSPSTEKPRSTTSLSEGEDCKTNRTEHLLFLWPPYIMGPIMSLLEVRY